MTLLRQTPTATPRVPQASTSLSFRECRLGMLMSLVALRTAPMSPHRGSARTLMEAPPIEVSLVYEGLVLATRHLQRG